MIEDDRPETVEAEGDPPQIEQPRPPIAPTFIVKALNTATLGQELCAAGVLDGVSFTAQGATVQGEVSAAALAKIRAVLAAHDPGAIDMPALRQAAFDRAMKYGNGITARVTGVFAAVEQPSWSAQEAEARVVQRGEALPVYALLPGLAEDKGVPLADYAETVIGLADRFRLIARAAIRLRREAEGLLAAEIDTPAALATAVEELRAQTLAAAAALGLDA